MDLPAHLDRLVHVTRLDSLTSYGKRPSYSFRWWPLVALFMLAGGYALLVTALMRQALPFRIGVAGAGLLVTGLVISVVLLILGPRFRDMGVSVDERDREIESRAGDLGGRVFELAVMLACFYFAVAHWLGGWVPEQPVEWSMLGVVLMVTPRLLRILIASWLQPRLDEED